jgi:hypothetical protein
MLCAVYVDEVQRDRPRVMWTRKVSMISWSPALRTGPMFHVKFRDNEVRELTENSRERRNVAKQCIEL